MRTGAMAVLLALATIAAPAAAEPVPITRLNVAPWLGPLKNGKDLLEKFVKEKKDFTSYIKYDLEKAVELKIALAEAGEIVNLMESAIKDSSREISVADGTAFKSMGWRSKKTGKIMRTANPVLRLGRPAHGFSVKILFKDYEIEYVFLKECGNIALVGAIPVLPPKAEIVPPDKAELPVAPGASVHIYVYPGPQAVVRELRPESQCQPPTGYLTLDAWRLAGCRNLYEEQRRYYWWPYYWIP